MVWKNFHGKPQFCPHLIRQMINLVPGALCDLSPPLYIQICLLCTVHLFIRAGIVGINFCHDEVCDPFFRGLQGRRRGGRAEVMITHADP